MTLFRPPRLAIRLGLDGAMVLLFVSSLAFRSTGREAHEWIGVLFCTVLAVHTAWNWGWYKTIFAGKYGARRTISITANLALVSAMAALCVCGILNSRHVFGFSQYVDGKSIRQIHSFAAYWGLVLIGIHTGLHLDMIAGVIRKKLGPREGSKGLTIHWKLAMVSFIVGSGVWASFERDMGAKLFLGFSFDFWSPDRPLIMFYAFNLAIMGTYAFIAHFAQNFIAVQNSFGTRSGPSS